MIKHFVVTNNFIDAYGWLASERLWDRLSPEDQEIVRDLALSYAQKSIDVAEENDRAHQRKLEEIGINVVRLSDEELEAWAQQARTHTWPKLRSRLTDELIDGMLAAYAAQQAGAE